MIFGRKGYQPLFAQAKENDHACKLIPSITSSDTPAFRMISSLGNALFAVYTSRSSSNGSWNKDESRYANLEREIPVSYRGRTISSSSIRSIFDAAWDGWIVDP